MKKILTPAGIMVLFITCISGLHAQEYSADMERLMDELRMNNLRESSRNRTYYDVEGTPYLYEEGSQEGEIKIRGLGTHKGYFRYDMYADQVHFLVKGTYYAIGNPKLIEYVRIGEYTLVYAITDEKKGKGGYFELVSEGDCRLLAKKEVDLLPAVPPKAYSDPKPARFSHKSEKYFLQVDNGPARRITGKKDLFRYLEQSDPELEQYFQDEKPSFSNREDLIRLIDYYNTH